MAEKLAEQKQRIGINRSASAWASVIIGALQEHLHYLDTGLLLFRVMLLILLAVLNNILIVKVVDDTNNGNSIVSEQDTLGRLRDFRRISEWPDKWQMSFSVTIYIRPFVWELKQDIAL